MVWSPPRPRLDRHGLPDLDHRGTRCRTDHVVSVALDNGGPLYDGADDDDGAGPDHRDHVDDGADDDDDDGDHLDHGADDDDRWRSVAPCRPRRCHGERKW